MMSLIFIVGFLSLLLLPLTCISILFSLQPHHHHHRLASNAASKPGLSSVWRLLVHQTIFTHGHPGKAERKDAVGVRRYAGRRPEGGEADECGVCLCEVEEGEEIGDLRCNHVFHKDCLEAWIGTGRATCPMCRGRVFAPAVAEDGCSEVLFFQFCSLTSSRRGQREDNWWLR